jgi:hypothetical protein
MESKKENVLHRITRKPTGHPHIRGGLEAKKSSTFPFSDERKKSFMAESEDVPQLYIKGKIFENATSHETLYTT